MQEGAKNRRKIPVRYLAVTVFCLIVSVIYDHFSHGIHSFWMQYLALWPFLLGFVPALLEAAGLFPFKKGKREGSGTEETVDAGIEVLRDIYRFGIAAVTVAGFLSGVLEIAGTDSFYPEALLYAGAVMLLCGAVGYLVLLHRNKHGSL